MKEEITDTTLTALKFYSDALDHDDLTKKEISEAIELIEKERPRKCLLKVGDTVLWKGSWGRDEEKEAVIDRIEANCINKEGDEVDSIEWNKVNDDSVVVDLKNGHWAYGSHIRRK